MGFIEDGKRIQLALGAYEMMQNQARKSAGEYATVDAQKAGMTKEQLAEVVVIGKAPEGSNIVATTEKILNDQLADSRNVVFGARTNLLNMKAIIESDTKAFLPDDAKDIDAAIAEIDAKVAELKMPISLKIEG